MFFHASQTESMLKTQKCPDFSAQETPGEKLPTDLMLPTDLPLC